MFGKWKSAKPEVDLALPGRSEPVSISPYHFVKGHPMCSPYPMGFLKVLFGMGCFWGAERKFWQVPGVYLTAVGYAGGDTPNPSYEEVCSGNTGHAEVVQVVYDPAKCEFEQLLGVFWESHDPTQGLRQGNDVGSQYRSVIYTTVPQQHQAAIESLAKYQRALSSAGHLAEITTEVEEASIFYFAEAYHQQYLAKNPNGYCGLGGLGVEYPLGRAKKEPESGRNNDRSGCE